MAAILTRKFRTSLALQFKDNFSSLVDSYYIGIGKPTPWSNEFSPDIPKDSAEDDNKDYQDIYAAKRITGANVSLSIPRYDWTSGLVYTIYDESDATLYTKKYYVVNDSFDVYKCIWNNNGAQSTIKPTGNLTTIFTTADGYHWKYMYTISAADALKFASSNWIPVKRLTTNDGSTQWLVQTAAIDGTINAVVMTNQGTGYVGIPSVTIDGDGTGATATASVTAGSVTHIIINNPGINYTYATVTIAPPASGITATARPIFAPQGGHGKDAMTELGAFYVIANITLAYDEGGLIPTNNDYRKVLMLKNPLLYGTSTVATSSVYNLSRHIQFTVVSGTGFVADELITGQTSGATGRVVSYDSTTKIVNYIPQNNMNFTTTESVVGGTSLVTGTNATIINPSLTPRSGEIIYKDYRQLVSRAPDQREQIIVVVEL
jgi:hypothetical protein